MVKQPMTVNGVTRWRETGAASEGASQTRKPVVLRQEIGDVLRDIRQRQGRTLREVSHNAHVSLGYLSEVERGQKEASSDLLASICAALDVSLSMMLREVSDRVALAEGIIPDAHMAHIPDTVPHELDREYVRTVSDEIGKSLKNDYITAA